ncbi:Sn1-specific diacylglycerol lipase alpha [Quillaja saponaria]|uniref:Sn1-specific diacylglycerol lipase alpha n=1 Tax=Quillaja saponaria TaxID=32244 RepID=A0AAD7VIL3_QUISA|nr:Sn1-specific diacylglycerol lipase alpha [Quillaja saponaria]
MANPSLKRLLNNMYSIKISAKRLEQGQVYSVLNQFQLRRSRADKAEVDMPKDVKDKPQVSFRSKVEKKVDNDSDYEDLTNSKWKLELDWLTKALEPALELCRRALPRGDGIANKSLHSSRSFSEIIASIQRSKIGIQGWSLSDLTIGLYLIYLRQASTNPFEDIKGIQISSESIVQDLIYHTELAKGAYKENAAGLARNSMLRENNVLKFVRNSSVMRPGYFIGIDTRKKLVILGIRGTHTVYDLITDIVSSSDGEVTYEGYSTHFGTAEAARWFLCHELGTIRNCLDKYEGFRLRLVGHSLGGAIASLLAIMIHRKSLKELGFSPDIVSAVGYGTPPCVSKELAESCSDYVTTVVMQDDIIPRLSVASLTRLRNEILQTDWMSVVEKEDWKSVIDLVTNAKQVVSSVQDVARKLADYAKFGRNKFSSDGFLGKEQPVVPVAPPTSKSAKENAVGMKSKEAVCTVSEELFIPGTVYCLKRNLGAHTSGGKEFFTLWKRHPSEHFQRIILSSNLISDHKCDSHYYALRDVLKGFPWSGEEGISK